MKGDPRTVLEALVKLLTEKGVLTASEILEAAAFIRMSRTMSAHVSKLEAFPEGIDLTEELENVERNLVRDALRQANGRKTEAARLLRIDRNRLNYLCRKHRL